MPVEVSRTRRECVDPDSGAKEEQDPSCSDALVAWRIRRAVGTALVRLGRHALEVSPDTRRAATS